MPQEIEIDGVVQQYYSPDEIEAAKAEAIAAKEEEFTQRQKDLDELQNPNIKVLREKAKRLEALERSGKDINEKGEVVEINRGMTAEEAARIAVESTRKEMLGSRLGEFLDNYDDEKKKVVEHYYNKISAGEDVSLKNMGEYIRQAEKLADVDAPNPLFNKIASSNGSAPSVDMGGKSTDFAETDQGKEWAGTLGLKI